MSRSVHFQYLAVAPSLPLQVEKRPIALAPRVNEGMLSEREEERTSTDKLAIVVRVVRVAFFLSVGIALRSHETGYVPEIDTYHRVSLLG